MNNPDHEVWLHLGKSALWLWCELGTRPRSRQASAGVTANGQPPPAPAGAVRTRKELPDGWTVGSLDPDQVTDHQGWVKDNSVAEYRRQDVADDRAFFGSWYSGEEVSVGVPSGNDDMPSWAA